MSNETLLITIQVTCCFGFGAIHRQAGGWHNHEDRAYRIWVKQNHREYVAFSKLREDYRRAYWNWRHQHSDAELKIDIK